MSDDKKQLRPEFAGSSIFDAPEAPEPGATAQTVGNDGKEFYREVDVEGIDPYDHTDEVRAARAEDEAAGVAPPDMPEHRNIPLRNPAMMDDVGGELKEEIERRFREDYGARKVEVSPADRDAFARAALHDTELILDVYLEGLNTTVSVAMPTDVFTASASVAAKEWGTVRKFNDPTSEMQWLLSFQQIHVWYQVRAVDGVSTPWSAFFIGDRPDIGAIKRFIADPDNFAIIFEMSNVRWRMLMEAVRIAELKYKICLERWQDRTFFTTADTA